MRILTLNKLKMYAIIKLMRKEGFFLPKNLLNA